MMKARQTAHIPVQNDDDDGHAETSTADDNTPAPSKITLTFLTDTTFLTGEAPISPPSSPAATLNSNDAFVSDFLKSLDASFLLLMKTTDDDIPRGGDDDDGGDANNSLFQAQTLMEMEPIEASFWRDRWIRNAQSFGAVIPTSTAIDNKNNDKEIICDVVTPAVSFPGFRVLSKIKLGIKFVEEINTYQFVQLDDSTEARGLKPLVWLHNKLTGKDRNTANSGVGGGGSQRARSFCTLRPVLTEDRGVQFEYKVFLEVQLQFPKRFARLLPMSVQQANNWGSTALTNTVTKNAPENLDRLLGAYKEYSKA